MKKKVQCTYAEYAADTGRLASALSSGERATLIRLLKKIGYKAAAASKQEAKDHAA